MSTYRAVNEQSRERIIALLLLLERAFTEHKPLTQEEILRDLKIDEYPVASKGPKKVRAYEGSDTAVRQKFERDKARIREFGFEVETVVLPDDTVGYQVDPASAYAPAIHFTEAEQRVVQLALRFCGFGHSGAFSVFNEVPAGDGGLEYSAYYNPVVRAQRLGRAISFEYQSSVKKTRIVEPLITQHLNGISYLVARVAGTDEVKGYRFSRMTSMPVVLPDTFEVDDAARAVAEAWRPAYQKTPTPIDLVVLTNTNYADLLLRQYPDAVAAHKSSGKVEVGLSFDNPHSALWFVLEGADRVRLQSPKTVIKELEAWLRSVNRGKVPSLDKVKFSSHASNDVLGETLQLLHAIYNAPDGLRLSELAQRFSMDIEHVRLVMGRIATLEPMVDAHDGSNRFPARIMKHCDEWENEAADDSTYMVEYDDGLDEPSAFMWRDLFELNIALREASRIYSDPAIISAIDKIENVAAEFVRVEHSGGEQLLAAVHEALANHEQLKITYTSGVTETPTERWIEPREIKVLNGRSYVRAYCASRGDWRTFRIDRIGAILAKSPSDAIRPTDPVANWLTAVGEGGDEVIVLVDSATRFLFEPLPGAQWGTVADGRHAVKFRVSDRAFLDHLMLLAGDGAVVATEAYAKAGHDLAQRIASQL